MEVYLFFLFLFIIYNIFYYFNTDSNNKENNLIKEKENLTEEKQNFIEEKVIDKAK